MSHFCGRMALAAMLVLSSLFAFGRANEASAAVEYVKVCSLYGAGFFYVPGTDTCIKLGGYLRTDYAIGTTGTYIEQAAPANAPGYRLPTSAYNARQQSCYGTSQTFGRVAALPQNNNCILLNPGGTYQIFAPGQPTGGNSYFNWSGFYVGASGGYAWGSRDITATESAGGVPFFDGNFGTRNVQGGFGGAQFGYNWQRSHWVYGFEVDAQGGNIDGRSREIVTPYFGPGSSISLRTQECVDFIGSLRLRVGYTQNNLLVYATGGAAVASVDTRLSMMDSFGFDAKAKTETVRGGYTVGAGFEYKVNQNWSVMAEYRYIDLRENFTTAQEFLGPTPTGSSIANTTRLDFNIVRAGMNFRFDGGGTSVFLTPTPR